MQHLCAGASSEHIPFLKYRESVHTGNSMLSVQRRWEVFVSSGLSHLCANQPGVAEGSGYGNAEQKRGHARSASALRETRFTRSIDTTKRKKQPTSNHHLRNADCIHHPVRF